MKKIGMIGMSPGNAHPYSWTAIINGKFSAKEINEAGFPAVADYLEANRDTLGINGAQVTHIWCDDFQRGVSIAKSGGIENVVEHLDDLVGAVDAIILGRDDPEHHWTMAEPFLEANIPIFIDKPLTISRKDLSVYSNYIQQGRFLMSCSSMRYASEVLAAKATFHTLGDIHLISAVGKKDWKKYGVHMVEATLSLLDDPRPISVQYLGKDDYDIVLLEITPKCYATIHLVKDISATFQLNVYGDKNWTQIDIRNSYGMFKENILEFVKGIYRGEPTLDFNKTAQVIQVVAGAIESKNNAGEKIKL